MPKAIGLAGKSTTAAWATSGSWRQEVEMAAVGSRCWGRRSLLATCAVRDCYWPQEIAVGCERSLLAVLCNPDEEDEGGQASSSLAVFAGYRYPASQSRECWHV
ncbi:hypothetical protein GW17_00039812 [Ensete ventricosum]|nr:hypothetical protein GW17_00039812 [Ensete ventricosum]